MSDDLIAMLDGLVDDARAAARLGDGADIRRRARRQTHRVFLGAGTLAGAALALVVAVASTVTGSPAPASTGSPSPLASSTPSRIAAPSRTFPPDPAVYHPEAWLPPADAPMASLYQWTFEAHGSKGAMAVPGMAVIPVCGSQTVGASSMDGLTQVADFHASAGNGTWVIVSEMLHFLPSAQAAATTYTRLLPDLGKCLGGASGFAGTDLSAGFTAHTANGFGWYQRYRSPTSSTSAPGMAAQYLLVARRGSVIAIFSAAATWAPENQGPIYDTSGDQRALDALVAHLAVYSDPTS